MPDASRLVVTENITVDGVIDLDSSWFSPGDGSDNGDLVASLRESMTEERALLLGRITFEQFRGYWPNQTDDTTGISTHLNEVAKYVVSSTLTEPGWTNSTVLRGDLAEDVRALKERHSDGIIGCTGSVTLVRALLAAGLVDEFRLYQYPVVAGSGRRMFEGIPEGSRLELVDSRRFRAGVVLSTYRVAGALQPTT